MKTVLEDIDTIKRREERAAQGRAKMLYSAFIQDSLEFLMTIAIPIDKYTKLNSYKDLLNFKEIKAESLKELQEWLDPLIKTSQFMHFFNNEVHSLPQDIL